jgi:hypothetical protein
MRTFIISIGLALALLTVPASAASADDLPSANDVMPSCQSLLRKV